MMDKKNFPRHNGVMAKAESLVCINGSFVPPEEAFVSVFDRGFLYGDSVYDVTLTYDGIPFLLDLHLDRLEQSAQKIAMEISWAREKLTSLIYEGIKRLEGSRHYIRLIITRGGGEIGLDPNLSDGQNLFLIFKELEVYPQEWYDAGLSLVTTEIMKTPKKSMDPSVKSGNYLNNVLALQKAKEKGAYDAVMLNHLGNVTESTSANIWMIEKGTFKTPPLSAGILGGLTRQSVLEIGEAHGLEMREVDFNAQALKEADEVFITSSTREILPITKIDGQPIGKGVPGTHTKKLHALYKEFVKDAVEREKKKAQALGLLT